MDTQSLLKQRGSEYGETHYLVGLVIKTLEEPFIQFVRKTPELVHNWVLMMSKLIRILHSPYKRDNYDDLIGYAELCRKIIGASNVDISPDK